MSKVEQIKLGLFACEILGHWVVKYLFKFIYLFICLLNGQKSPLQNKNKTMNNRDNDCKRIL